MDINSVSINRMWHRSQIQRMGYVATVIRAVIQNVEQYLLNAQGAVVAIGEDRMKSVCRCL